MKLKNLDMLPKGRVKLMLINPSYSYFGVILGRDSNFIYLDTGDYMGVLAIQYNNILYIKQEKEKKEV